MITIVGCIYLHIWLIILLIHKKIGKLFFRNYLENNKFTPKLFDPTDTGWITHPSSAWKS